MSFPLPSLFVLAAAMVAGAVAGQSRPMALIAALSVLSAAVLMLLVWRSQIAGVVLAGAIGLTCGAGDRAGDDRAGVRPVDIAQPGWHTGVIRGPAIGSAGGYRAVLETSDGRLLVTAVGEGAPPLPGDRVRAHGRLDTEARYLGWGVAGERQRLRAAGVIARLVTSTDRIAIVEPAAERSGWRPAARLQRRIAGSIEARDPESDGAAVIAALVTGDRSGIDDELSEALRRAGVGHLLAVSGLHIGALAWLVFAAVRRVWSAAGDARIDPDTTAAFASLAVSIAYAMTTGGRPSALRALLVIAVLLIGRARALRARITDALGVAALILVALEPAVVFDPSFQMSFGAAAVLSLAFAGRRPGSVAGRVRDLAAASAWASAATAPAAAALFGELAPVAVLTNIVAIPAVALVVLPLAMIGAALSLVAAPLGGPPLDLAIAGADLLCAGSRLVARVAPALPLPPLAPLELAGWIAGLAALLAARRRRRPLLALAGAALCAAVIAAASWSPPPGGLRVTFIDVGQGDAALVETPGGEAMLIDTGGLPGGGDLERRQVEAPGARAVLPLLRYRGIRRLAVVAVSHPHPDHHAGLGALLGAVDIDEVWIVSDRPLPPPLAAVLRALRVGGARVRAPPERRSLGGVAIEVLAPRYLGRLAADPVSSVNDNSMVLALGYAGRRVLFTGDIEADGEELLLGNRRDRLRADAVKVAHHGSRTSSIEPFVAATGATEAIISCGRQNRFGFPDPGVIARWRAAGARVSRTDVAGSIELTIREGGELELRAHSPVR